MGINNKQRMIITIGIPASGKSTWAKQFVEDNPEFLRVERDELRANGYTATGNLWDYKFGKHKEAGVTLKATDMIRLALKEGRSVMVSDTNLREGIRRQLQMIASEHNIEIENQVFDVPFHQALKWNAKRPNHVPESVMIHMERRMRQYLGKFVQTPESRLRAQKTHLFSCVIMDLDGTLADMRGIRGPFEWSRVGEDKVIEHVAEYARFLWSGGNHDLVLFSGRDGSCRAQTEDWLAEHNIGYDQLHMRPAGSTINDSILKEQMYMDHLHDGFFVDHVVDDRQSVVRMWQSTGLPVMDVGNGTSDF